MGERLPGQLQVVVGAGGGDAETVSEIGDGGGMTTEVVISGGVGRRQGLDELDIEGMAGGFEQHQVLVPLVGRGRLWVLQPGNDDRTIVSDLPQSHTPQRTWRV